MFLKLLHLLCTCVPVHIYLYNNNKYTYIQINNFFIHMYFLYNYLSTLSTVLSTTVLKIKIYAFNIGFTLPLFYHYLYGWHVIQRCQASHLRHIRLRPRIWKTIIVYLPQKKQKTFFQNTSIEHNRTRNKWKTSTCKTHLHVFFKFWIIDYQYIFVFVFITF